MQNYTLSDNTEVCLVTCHRRKGSDPRITHDHTIVGTVSNGYVLLSYAFCHKKDNYDKKIGRGVALDRLIHCLENETYATETLVGVIPLADVIHYNIYDTMARIGIDAHEDVAVISEALAEQAEKSENVRVRNLVCDAIEICEEVIGSKLILKTHLNHVYGKSE